MFICVTPMDRDLMLNKKKGINVNDNLGDYIPYAGSVAIHNGIYNQV